MPPRRFTLEEILQKSGPLPTLPGMPTSPTSGGMPNPAPMPPRDASMPTRPDPIQYGLLKPKPEVEAPQEEGPEGGWLPNLVRGAGPVVGSVAGGALGTLAGGVGALPGIVGGGAVGGAGGEYLAQMLEGRDDTNWKRVAAETAIGAVPIGKGFSLGKMALHGGLSAAGSEGVRSATEDDEFSAGSMLGAGAMGATGGALAGKMLKRFAPGAAKSTGEVVEETTGDPLARAMGGAPPLKPPTGGMADAWGSAMGTGKGRPLEAATPSTAAKEFDDLVAKSVRGQGDKFATSPATSLQVRGEVGAPKPVTGTAPKPAGSVAPAPTPPLPSTGASAAKGGDSWADFLDPLKPPLTGSPGQRAAGNDLLYRTLKRVQEDAPQEGLTNRNIKDLGIGKELFKAKREAPDFKQLAKGAPTSKVSKALDFAKPDSATSLGTGVVGAGLGAALGMQEGEEDEEGVAQAGVAGPLGGALAGFVGGTAGGRGLGKAAQNVDWTQFQQPGRDLLNRFSNAYRASLLTSANLPANAVTAPAGAVASTALEELLAGNPRLAKELAKEFAPSRLFNKGKYDKNLNFAREAVRKGSTDERADFTEVANPNLFDRITQKPAIAMTTGDARAREAITDAAARAGMGAEAANKLSRVATLTSDPNWNLSQGLVDFQNRSPVAKTVLPFAKTVANVVEQGTEKLPGIGFIPEAMRRSRGEAPKDIARMAAEQGLGGAAIGAGWGAGELEDKVDLPTTAMDDVVKKMIVGWGANTAGRYGLPFSVGYGAQRSFNEDEDPLIAALAGLKRGATEFPMPSLELFSSAADTAQRLKEEGAPESLEEFLEMRTPLVPGALRDAYKLRYGN